MGRKQGKAVQSMSVRGYVLIETEVGRARAVATAVESFSHKGAKLLVVDTVTGPYDVVAQIEADDLDTLGDAITEAIQKVPGVQRTTTCLAVRPK
jgi:DNA-binding Lrp family transcriptional regulator